MAYYDKEEIVQLQKWGYDVLLYNKRANEYHIHINRLIRDNLDKCQLLFPEWVNWSYIRELFIPPKCENEDFNKRELKKYNGNRGLYPFQLYIHWEPQDIGNLLYNDGKFLNFLYKQHKDYFTDASKYKTVSHDVKTSIQDFIDNSYKTALVVDCENSDVYKLYGMLQSLDPVTLEKIAKIILYDDINTNNGWDYLEIFTKIPVEHCEVDRVLERKSIVDIRMTSGICREFYKNEITSFILLSSDSDYWGLISSLPEADFLVVIEHDKCSKAVMDKLIEQNIYYCALDDFCTGYIDDLKKAVLTHELKKRLPEVPNCNGKELAHQIFTQARISAGENEIMRFYDKYIKTLRLVVDDDGNFSVQLK